MALFSRRRKKLKMDVGTISTISSTVETVDTSIGGCKKLHGGICDCGSSFLSRSVSDVVLRDIASSHTYGVIVDGVITASMVCKDLKFIHYCMEAAYRQRALGVVGGGGHPSHCSYTSSHSGVHCGQCYSNGERDFNFIENDEGALVCSLCCTVTSGYLSVGYGEGGGSPILSSGCCVLENISKRVVYLCEDGGLNKCNAHEAIRVMQTCYTILVKRLEGEYAIGHGHVKWWTLLPCSVRRFSSSLLVYVTQTLFGYQHLLARL